MSESTEKKKSTGDGDNNNELPDTRLLLEKPGYNLGRNMLNTNIPDFKRIIIVLSCLNLDLVDLPKFADQFRVGLGLPETEQNIYFLIDHIGPSKLAPPFNSNSAQQVITRIDINKFIQDEIENEIGLVSNQSNNNNPAYKQQNLTQITTRDLYKEFIAYQQRINMPDRRLIENIFYFNPQYIEFVKYYLFSIIKLISLVKLQTPEVHLISCDPIFHHLLEALKTYNQAAVSTFYNYQKIMIWAPPIGWPINFPSECIITKLNKKTFARFNITYIQQTLTIIKPQILDECRPDDDIYNLDLITTYINTRNQLKFQGQIKGVIELDDIITGLENIFRDGLINRQLRVPRHLLLPNTSHTTDTDQKKPINFEILIIPQYIPRISPIRVLADLAQQLDYDIISRYNELIIRDLKLLEPELEELALKWELQIQKYIKIPVIIKLVNNYHNNNHKS